MDSHKDCVRGESSPSFDYEGLLNTIKEEEIKNSIEFLGSEPLTIKTTNAQEIYNYYQMFPKILVFDLRSTKRYMDCHLKCSINFPVDVFRDNNFINFDPADIIENHLVLKVDKEAFKARKRAMCFIVANHTCTSDIFQHLTDLFDQEKLTQLKSIFPSDSLRSITSNAEKPAMFSAEDILATRNSILLYKALKKDKIREVYICRNSFNVIEGKYPFM